MDRPYGILFLCTGNSARSIIAESIVNRRYPARFVAYSAGSQPKGAVHPEALRLLHGLGHDTTRLRSKSWSEFATPDAPVLDFVVTVCDSAAGEACPVWPGQPIRAHWGVPDPAAATGSESEMALAFADTYRMLGNRIDLFASLPIESLDRLATKQRMDAIGGTDGQRPAT